MNGRVIDVTPNDAVRHATIKYMAGQRPAENVAIQPGVTAGELLQQLGLGQGYQVSKGGVDTVFGHAEPLWPRVNDGDALYVTSVVDAG